MRGQFLLPLPLGEGWGEGLASTKCFDFLLPISHKIIFKLVVGPSPHPTLSQRERAKNY